MLSYELAKQLKDAGFKQDWSEWEDHDQELLKASWDMYGKGYSPTLEELIDACGTHFRELRHNVTPDNWDAIYDKRKPNYKRKIIRNGKTHLEAMANLYIKLNE